VSSLASQQSWTTVHADVEIFEDIVVLDRGRAIHHSAQEELVRNLSTVGPDRTRTHLLHVVALKSPWCLGIYEEDARDAPIRALHTDHGWVARWKNGVFRVGDGKAKKLGDYGISNLLLPPEILATSLRHPSAEVGEIKINSAEIENQLIQAAPQLVVLGSDHYQAVLLPDRGVIRRWEGIVNGDRAMSIDIVVDRWDAPAEFRV
jgi:hypothetical protein